VQAPDPRGYGTYVGVDIIMYIIASIPTYLPIGIPTFNKSSLALS
jgi:hypothetical protein